MTAAPLSRSPSRTDILAFAIVSLAYGVLTLAVIPWAQYPGAADPHIVLAYGTSILIADLCAALLLSGRYRATGRGALLLFACAYVYGALMVAAHMAVFPGALFAQPAFGGPETVGRLYIAWRLGMAALVLAALLRAGKPDAVLPQPRLDLRLALALAATIAATLTVAAIVANLPAQAVDGDRFSEVNRTVQWLSVAVCAAGLALICFRRGFGDVLYLWVGLVLVAWIADMTLSTVAGARYALGWHIARASLLFSACLLPAILLAGFARAGVRSRVAGAAAYGTAVAVALAAVYLRWVLEPWLGDGVPYVALYGAVAIAVWLGGWGPATLATVVAYLLVNLLFIAPKGAVAIESPADMIGLALFVLSSALVIVLGEGMRRARNRYQASEAELRERAIELQRADANKREFLAILSHELRNPLAPLRTGIAVLKRQRDVGAPGDVHDMMDRQIVQLTRLIDDLLDVSRIDRGKLELKSERVALDAAVRTAIETAKPNIGAKSHELIVRYAAQPLHVQGDSVRLAQAISNLLNNAAKFTPPGGHIELSLRAEGGEALVRVADDGIGLAPEHLARVFEMFFQLDPGRAEASGLGLGLALARAIVEQHGGRLEVRSAGPGKGSEFLIRLPLAAAPAAGEDKGAAVHALPAGRRILVVDDNADAADTLAELLRLEGHQVETALDAAAALRIAEARHPEVAFIDLNMPGTDGIELAKRLRAAPWGRAALLVAVTGMGQQADIERTRAAGFDEHLTKPADPARVMRLAALEPAALRSRQGR